MLAPLTDYLTSFGGALALTLLLTPLVREMNRRLGMVDRPDARRIHKTPIPRGGGLALFLGVEIFYALFVHFSGRPALQGVSASVFWRLQALSGAMAAVGLADDRFSLSPKLKLLCQTAVAALVWFWTDLGFADLWPAIPAWLDCVLTVFWIVGAVNAFNLIDGLDGLASGLALIATLGMAGALIFSGRAPMALFYFAFAGGLVGFLRYNYNPASVFLGDCGSMYIGFVLAVLPLCSKTPDSFLASVGVPLLAMGVPIFDTALAILRRFIRRLLNRCSNAPSGQVMAADTDHLHHRVMRAVGFSQRKAAWTLYVIAAFCVAVGLAGVMLRSRSAGVWMLALTVATVVIIKDLARIELFDAGRLFGSVAHSRESVVRRRLARLAVPIYLVFDALALSVAFTLVHLTLFGALARPVFLKALLTCVASVFFWLVALRVYRTVWPRAMVSNYMRLVLACFLGAVCGAAAYYYYYYFCYAAESLPGYPADELPLLALLFALVSAFLLVLLRIFRCLCRDMFYAIDCSQLTARKDVSRILVYGAGLRYRAFRRELVRSAAANDRIIVGLLDDDILLHGKYIGDVQVLGSPEQAAEIITRVAADTVVVACAISDERLQAVRALLAPTGVTVTKFTFSEQTI